MSRPVRPALLAAGPFLLAAALAAGACASDGPSEDLGIETYLHNAQGYVDGGHYDQALAEFRRALQIDPGNRKALLGEASCLYWVGTGESPAAGQAILEAEDRVEALDADAYGVNGWKVRLTRAMVHARLADLWGRKMELARKGVEDGDPLARKDLGAAEENRDRHEEAARESFLQVLGEKDEPMARDNLTALFFLASRGALRARSPAGYREPLQYFRRFAEQVEKSKTLWKTMIQKEPDLAELYRAKLRGAEAQEVELRDLVANIYFKQHRHEDSLGELDRVIALSPYRAPAFFNRGRNEEELGRFGAAVDDYNRFLVLTDLPSDSPLVVEAHDRLVRCEAKLRGVSGE